MKAFKRLKKTFRSFLVFVMVFLISGSSLNFAFATYGILVPFNPGSQTVKVEHIWVDKNNQYTTETVEKEDGSKELVSNNPNPKDEDATPRPDKVEVDVIGTIGGKEPDPENPVQFKELNPGEKPEDVTFPDASTKPSPDDPTANNTKDVISDTGYTAGENAGKHDAEAGKENSGENAGYDEGFNKGYQEGNPPAAGENPPAEGENPPAAGENPPAEGQNPPAAGENPPAEGQNPPAESVKPGGPLEQLDTDVADAIKDILAADKKDDNNVVIDNPTNEVDQEVKEDVDKITDELLDKEDETGAVRDQGNVWYESKDYVANVEVKEDGSKPPVTYEVELTDETKDALSKAGYETVQLKQTVETVFAVKDDQNTKYIDPYTGFDVDDPILAVCQHVSYDGGKTWQMVGEPVFRFSENGKPAGIYTPKDRNGAPVIDKNTGKNELTWDAYVEDLRFWTAPDHTAGEKKYDENGNPVDTTNEAYDVTRITEYDASRDYVQETTYTFMHVLKEPEPVPNDPTTPTTPTTPTQEVPEDPVPRVEPPEEEPLVDIPPEDVPLTTVPRTGDISSVWTMLALLSVTGLLGVTLLERKKANNS